MEVVDDELPRLTGSTRLDEIDEVDELARRLGVDDGGVLTRGEDAGLVAQPQADLSGPATEAELQQVLVEDTICGHEPGRVVIGGTGQGVLGVPAQILKLRCQPLGVLDGPSAQGLDRRPGQQRPDVDDLLEILARDRNEAEPAVRHGLDGALGDQRHHGLSDRAQRDPQLLGQSGRGVDRLLVEVAGGDRMSDHHEGVLPQ